MSIKLFQLEVLQTSNRNIFLFFAFLHLWKPIITRAKFVFKIIDGNALFRCMFLVNESPNHSKQQVSICGHGTTQESRTKTNLPNRRPLCPRYRRNLSIQIIYSCFSGYHVPARSTLCTDERYTTHDSSIRSDEGLTLETQPFWISARWSIYIVIPLNSNTLPDWRRTCHVSLVKGNNYLNFPLARDQVVHFWNGGKFVCQPRQANIFLRSHDS